MFSRPSADSLVSNGVQPYANGANGSPALSPLGSGAAPRRLTADSTASNDTADGHDDVKVQTPILSAKEAAPRPLETEEERHTRLRNKVTLEFFATEETYVEQLDALLAHFVYPLVGPGLAANPPWLTKVRNACHRFV